MPDRESLERIGLFVSRETSERLEFFSDRLRHWSGRINLVSATSSKDVWRRHILDSAQIFPLRRPDTRRWCDIGSGGGLPGMIVAILASELEPEMDICLIESDQRKASFLRIIAQELGVKTSVIATRAEYAPHARAQTVSARALAPLSKLLGYVHRHMAEDGLALLPKGRNVHVEIEEARRNWGFALDIAPSMIEAEASILCITKLERTTDKA